MTALRQTSFLGGELAPTYWGRADSPLFAQGLKRCENFFVAKQGSLLSRPGTRFVNTAKYGTLNPGQVRLVPYVYSDSVSFVLEVGFGGGAAYIRSHSWNGTTDTTVDITLVAPWAQADLPQLQWAQQGSFLTLVHPGYPPKQVYRDAGGTWHYGDVDFSLPTLVWRSIPMGTQDCGGGVNPEPMIIWNAAYVPIGSGSPAINLAPFTESATVPLKNWQYAVTAIIKDATTGALVETRPYVIGKWYDGTNGGAVSVLNTGQQVAVGPGKALHIRRKSPSGGAVAAVNVLTYNYYKGQEGLFGYIGSSTELEFVDDGVAPNYNIQPLKASPPTGYPWALDGAGGTFDYPAAVAYFEGRRVFSGGNRRPGTLLPSATNNYVNLDDYTLPWAGMPLKFDLASNKRERIRSLVGLQQLLVLTDTSAWAVSGGAMGQPLDFDTVAARVVDETGGTHLRPLVSEGRVLYVRQKGIGVRLLVPGPQATWQAADVSTHAGHLFTGWIPQAAGQAPQRNIVDWCYAKDPWGVIWAIRADGTLLSATPGGASLAWARHPFNGTGTEYFLASCSVPEGQEDAVYFAVYRNGTTCIERMESRVLTGSVEDVAVLDCAVRTSITAGVATTLTGLTPHAFRNVWVSALGNKPLGPFLVNGLGQTTTQVTLPNANDLGVGGVVDLYVGLPFTPEVELLDAVSAATRNKQRSVVRVGFEVSTAQGVYVGQDASHLHEGVPGLATANFTSDPSTAAALHTAAQGTYDTKGRAVLRQTLPLPVQVLAITREEDFGG